MKVRTHLNLEQQLSVNNRKRTTVSSSPQEFGIQTVGLQLGEQQKSEDCVSSFKLIDKNFLKKKNLINDLDSKLNVNE